MRKSRVAQKLDVSGQQLALPTFSSIDTSISLFVHTMLCVDKLSAVNKDPHLLVLPPDESHYDWSNIVKSRLPKDKCFSSQFVQ